jgi:hypothetical protein
MASGSSCGQGSTSSSPGLNSIDNLLTDKDHKEKFKKYLADKNVHKIRDRLDYWEECTSCSHGLNSIDKLLTNTDHREKFKKYLADKNVHKIRDLLDFWEECNTFLTETK